MESVCQQLPIKNTKYYYTTYDHVYQRELTSW